jgi:hypothetical protein
MNHCSASAPLAERLEPRSDTDTRLHGYWLVLARLVCITLWVLSVGLFVGSILSYTANLHLPRTGLEPDFRSFRLIRPNLRPIYHAVRQVHKLNSAHELTSDAAR